jgi:hypothetical protein
MPAYKTFSSYAEKLSAALDLIEQGKHKQAVTIIKRVQASAEKRGAKSKGPTEKSTTKRAPNKYMLYMQEHRPQFVMDHPGMPPTEVMSKIAAAYRKVKDTWEPSDKAKVVKPAKKIPAKPRKAK